MKKIILIASIVLLIAVGAFFFFWNGKEKLSDFFSGGADFGSFFDIEPQSQNDFVQPEPTTTPEPQGDTAYVAPLLRQISFEPIAGYTFYATSSTFERASTTSEGVAIMEQYKATTTAVRFQERATGHIYDVFEFILAPEKVSNITIQKIYRTLFSNNKNQFLSQVLVFNNEQIRSTFNTLIFSTSTPPTPPNLRQNDISTTIDDFTYNPYSNKLVYSLKQNGQSILYTSNIDKTGEKVITTISFNEFTLDPINATEVLLTTKASQTATGYAYVLNITTGSLTKIIGGELGLLAKVSPDKTYYLYSQSEPSKPSIRSYNSKTGATALLSISTIPEKCVFSQLNSNEVYCFGSLIYQAAQYPDDWYKGKVFNNESLYKIDLTDNYVTIVYSFDADQLSFDVINPQLTFKDNFMLFENKYDLTLWSLDLKRIRGETF